MPAHRTQLVGRRAALRAADVGAAGAAGSSTGAVVDRWRRRSTTGASVPAGRSVAARSPIGAHEQRGGTGDRRSTPSSSARRACSGRVDVGGGRRHVADATRARLLARRVDLARVDAVLDHPQREVVLPLFAQDAAQQFDVVVVELAVSRRRAFRVDQALALEEADLRDRDVGELLEQQPEYLSDRQVLTSLDRRSSAQASVRSKNTSRNLPIWSSSP